MKDFKAFVKTTFYYFVPFVVMSVIATVLLQRAFSMLKEQNILIMKNQISNILTAVEGDVTLTAQISNEICADSALSRKKVTAFDAQTLKGIERLRNYGSMLSLNQILLLSYGESMLLTKDGSVQEHVFAANRLSLKEESIDLFESMMQSTETIQNNILEKKDGTRLLFLLYYYPQTRNIDEKRIGCVFEESVLQRRLADTVEGLKGTVFFTWNDRLLTMVTDATGGLNGKEAEEYYKEFLENESNDYTKIVCEGKNYKAQIQVYLDNEMIGGSLIETEIKMLVIGLICFICMAAFLWIYSRHRYRLIVELRQIALNNHSGEKILDKTDDFEIIQMVLQNNYNRISKQKEVFDHFQKEAKSQLSWMLLNSALPEDIHAKELLEDYGIVFDGSYYCVLEFLIEEAPSQDMEMYEIPEVLIHSVIRGADYTLFAVGAALSLRDEDHSMRLSLIEEIQKKLEEAGCSVKGAFSGLVYEQIDQIHSSQAEALSVVQFSVYMGKMDKVLFFDEFANVTKRVPHVITELMEELVTCIRNRNAAEAVEILQRLTAIPEDVAKDLHIYVRYKIIQLLMDEVDEKSLNVSQMNRLMSFVELSDQVFYDHMKDYILEIIGCPEKKKADVKEIVTYIEERWSDSSLSLADVAEQFEISERSVNRMLKSSIQQTYKEYLDSLRLKKTCELLDHTEMDIKDVVKAVGYFDISSFNRLFKKYKGMTPTEYRSRNEEAFR